MSLPDVDIPTGDDLATPFARRVAVVIAIATLLAAIVGFLQNDASSRNGAASQQAQWYAIEAGQALVQAQERARVTVDAWSTSREQRVRAANISQQMLFAPVEEKPRLEATHGYWVKLAERTEALSGVDRASPEGPDLDPAFPSRLLAITTRDAIRLQALEDAANELGERWSGQSTTYTAVLAVLAVALYLLGFSLIVAVRRAKLMFATIGIALVVAAGAWTIGQVTTSPTPAPDEAADAFADGMVELETAFDEDGWNAAVEHLTRAIDLRPTFARAYLGRATAEFSLGSPQVSGLLSVASDEALRKSTADLADAYRMGLDDSELITDLGFQRFLQGIRGDDGRLQEAIGLSRLAVARNRADPIPRFNLAVALLGAGQFDEAQAAYRDAIARVIYSDLPAGVRRNDDWTEMQVVAGALTDIGILVTKRPDLADIAEEISGTIIASVARGEAREPGTTGTSVRVDGLKAEVFPSLVMWSGRVTGLDDPADSLSVIWSRSDPDGTDWAVIPNVSSFDVTPVPNADAGDGTQFAKTTYIGTTVPPRCLGDGTYRVELFVDGRPVGSDDVTVASGSYQAFAAHDVGAAFCHPADWTHDPGDELGMSAGFVGPARGRGVAVMHVQAPAALLEGSDALGTLMDAAVGGLRETLGSEATYSEESGTTHPYFMDLGSTAQRWYYYDKGWVWVGAGVDPAGGLYMGVVYGPQDWIDGHEWEGIVESFETFQ